MSWLSAIGGVVAAAFGATAISVGVASIVGGLVVGAAAGALYTAFKGGNLFKNMAFGALGGAALGGVGAFMTGGTGAFTATAQIGGLGAGQIATGMTNVWGAMGGAAAEGGGGGLLGGIGGALGQGSNLGGVSMLGAAFLNSLDADKDREADLAVQERRLELECYRPPIWSHFGIAVMEPPRDRANAARSGSA